MRSEALEALSGPASRQRRRIQPKWHHKASWRGYLESVAQLMLALSWRNGGSLFISFRKAHLSPVAKNRPGVSASVAMQWRRRLAYSVDRLCTENMKSANC